MFSLGSNQHRERHFQQELQPARGLFKRQAGHQTPFLNRARQLANGQEFGPEVSAYDSHVNDNLAVAMGGENQQDCPISGNNNREQIKDHRAVKH